MNTIKIEILESEVDEILAILYAVDAPVADQIADRIIAATVAVVDNENP